MINLTRRRFFRVLAIAPVAAVIAVKLPPPEDNISRIETMWNPDHYTLSIPSYLSFPPKEQHRTIYSSLPSTQWSKLWRK